MAFRVLFLENQMDIKVILDNLSLKKGDEEIRIPVSDISMIVIDNLKINLSARTMCLLAQKNVGVVLCDQQHLPIGYFSSYDNHSRISKKIGLQISMGREKYDVLWKDIVTAKLKNQAATLQALYKDKGAVEHIKDLSCEVIPGDPPNREAHGAKVYFNELMGKSFSRGDEDILLNSGLDYAYTIIRSYLARLCVGYGMNTQLGIHHKNEFNRFNLIDDIIEPVRPIIDFYVYQLLEGENYFTGEHRKAIINLLNHRIIYNNKNMFFCNMLEEYVSAVSQFIEGKIEYIIYPEVTGYLGESDEI